MIWKPHPIPPPPQFPFPKVAVPGGGPSFLFYQEQHRTNIFSDYCRQSIAGTTGISDLEETMQFIAAHVKAIRRIMKWFSIWCPEASKNYTRKGLGRNSFLFGDKEGGSQASVATWKRHSPWHPPPLRPQGGLQDPSVMRARPGVTDLGLLGFSINQADVF